MLDTLEEALERQGEKKELAKKGEETYCFIKKDDCDKRGG